MRDPILASKFNRLQLFFCETPTVRISLEAGFQTGVLRPSCPSTCSPFNHGIKQYRSGKGQVANFAKHDNSILIYTPNCCLAGIAFKRLYTVYLFEGTFSKSIKQKIMHCI